MHILFLDESGSPGDSIFAVGGIVVRADEWHLLRERWDECLKERDWPIDRELKWSGTQSGEVPPQTADAVYRCLAEMPMTSFVTVLYPEMARVAHDDLFATDEDTYATALTFLAERFQRFLEHHDSYGVIVLDSRRPETDDRMRRFFTRIQRDGTPFAELERIVDGLLMGPSHFSLGLQIADLVVGCTRYSRFARGDGSRWHRELLPTFARHPASGEVSGVGLKIFPDGARDEERPESHLFNPNEVGGVDP